MKLRQEQRGHAVEREANLMDVDARRRAIREVLRSRRGMSLIEIMVVIAIIVILMSVIAIGVMNTFSNAQIDTTILAMNKVDQQVQMYVLRKRKPPSQGDGLKAVFSNEQPPADSWGTPFKYVSPGPNGLDYDIISLGADGREGGSGNDADIRWSEVKNQ